MRLQSSWVPHIARVGDSPVDRLTEALAGDILAGRLSSGERLPPHRELAWKLDLGLGTVTKAYGILERRGLVRSVKGRGTFVATVHAHKGPAIDLSINTPPAMLGDRRLVRTLSTIARTIDIDHLNLYAPPAGHIEHRRLLAKWLEALGVTAAPDNLVVTGGAQQAISLAFDLVCGSSGLIITERLTYPGAIAFARHRGHRLRGVQIDAEGMIPDDLDLVLRQEKSVANKLVYITPTIHNPTTATMGLRRRQAIADICRRHNVHVVEDGVYVLDNDAGQPAIATLSPQNTFYVTSLSKTLSPGLRIGVLVMPSGMETKADQALRAVPLSASPLGCAVLEDWLLNGVVDTVRASLRTEASRRSGLAVSILGSGIKFFPEGGLHVWLPMQHQTAELFATAAMALGVIVTPPEAVRVAQDDAETGVRLCLGGPTLDDLTSALSLLAKLNADPSALSTIPKEPVSR